MDSSYVLPQFRRSISLDFQMHNGNQVVVLRDATGLSEHHVSVPIAYVDVLRQFNAVHTVGAVLERFTNLGLDRESLEYLHNLLCEALFLDTPEVQAILSARRDEFREQDIRHASHSGAVYPADPLELERYMTSLRASSHYRYAGQGVSAYVSCAPHIDYRRGADTYATSLEMLASIDPIDTVFLLGTSHAAAETTFQFTNKSFSSPLGLLKNEKESVERITTRVGQEYCFQEEILHRNEHSLELQVPLCLSTASTANATIIPILVGSFHSYVTRGVLPLSDGIVADLISATAEEVLYLEQQGRRVAFHCGIDLAHVGAAFGDSGTLSKTEIDEVIAADQRLLQVFSAADSTQLFSHIAQDGDARRICGFPTMYFVFALFEQLNRPLRGTIVDYRYSFDPDTDCFVSFASAYWE